MKWCVERRGEYEEVLDVIKSLMNASVIQLEEPYEFVGFRCNR